jgi:hypothetical protein
MVQYMLIGNVKLISKKTFKSFVNIKKETKINKSFTFKHIKSVTLIAFIKNSLKSNYIVINIKLNLKKKYYLTSLKA